MLIRNNYDDKDLNLVSDENDEAIGFTAFATVSRNYGHQDVVLFDDVISDFGGYYDTNSSIFICPLNGVYGFGTSIYAGSTYFMNVRIMREKSIIVGLQVQEIPEYGNTGATLTVSECLAGEKIWVMSASDDTRMYGHITKKSVFYGFLLHTY